MGILTGPTACAGSLDPKVTRVVARAAPVLRKDLREDAEDSSSCAREAVNSVRALGRPLSTEKELVDCKIASKRKDRSIMVIVVSNASSIGRAVVVASEKGIEMNE